MCGCEGKEGLGKGECETKPPTNMGRVHGDVRVRMVPPHNPEFKGIRLLRRGHKMLDGNLAPVLGTRLALEEAQRRHMGHAGAIALVRLPAGGNRIGLR